MATEGSGSDLDSFLDFHALNFHFRLLIEQAHTLALGAIDA